MTTLATIPSVRLNDGQQEAADAFFAFLLRPDPEFIISGPGGTGKTFLMSYLIDNILPKYFQTCQLMGIEPEYEEVVMTATTNKAAEVLAVATQRPADTVHKFLGLKVKDDFRTGMSVLTQTTAWTVHEKKILFIDESSMIDSQLLHFIKEGMHKSKIIYVGDHSQLAPVMEPISPVYRTEKPFYQLLEPMRNNNQPALMEVCAQLRETVQTGIFKPIQIVPGVIDHINDAELQIGMETLFQTQTLDSRILAYTNARVMQYNDHIRQMRQLPNEFIEGEFLVNNSAIQLKERMMTVEEELTVVSRGKDIIDVPIQGDVSLKVRSYDLESRIGEILPNILIPVDRGHFDELLRYYKRIKNWPKYYYLKNTYPDLRPRDAATVHKSQGSTYENVFIDLGNISTCHQPNAVARMLYVAFTRPRSRIFLYGELAQKYGGLAR